MSSENGAIQLSVLHPELGPLRVVSEWYKILRAPGKSECNNFLLYPSSDLSYCPLECIRLAVYISFAVTAVALKVEMVTPKISHR